MLYTEAQQKAAEKVAQAINSMELASTALGNIHRGALGEGMLRHLKLQKSKIESVKMELEHAYKAMDYELDNENLLCQNGEEE